MNPTATHRIAAWTGDHLTVGHPFADFLLTNVPRLHERTAWSAGDPALPALYLSHGAPPTFEDSPWMQELFDWAHRLPTPRGIVIVSAHWESAPIAISSTAAGTPLVYDFGGFDPMYFRMRYDLPDANWLGNLVEQLMPSSQPVHRHSTRGLDHGAWVPLKVMYPLGEIPVIQLSLPTHDPGALLNLGSRLRELRGQGILVIGSGFMTHGLPFLRPEHFRGLADPAGWSRDFDAWAADLLLRGEIDALASYRQAPGMPYAHPTVEHFTPLFVTLGAGVGEPVDMSIEGFAMGLSKRSITVG